MRENKLLKENISEIPANQKATSFGGNLNFLLEIRLF